MCLVASCLNACCFTGFITKTEARLRSLTLVSGSHVEAPPAVILTQASSAAVLINHRVKPTESAVGRKVLSLEDCRSICLQNNLDLQAAALDESVKAAVEESNRPKWLPHLVGSGEVSRRDNQSYSYSDVSGAGRRQPQSVEKSGRFN